MNDTVRERWRSGAPPCVQALPEETWMECESDGTAEAERLRPVVERAYPRAEARALALLTWYGSGLGPWTGAPAYESVAARLLVAVPRDALLAALAGAAELSTEQLEGASRFFAMERWLRRSSAAAPRLPDALRLRLWAHMQAASRLENHVRARAVLGG